MIETWNSGIDFIHYGKNNDLTGDDREDLEISMLAMHLLQASLVLVNTLILQQILAEPEWADRLTGRDKQALSALIWSHINPYGTFHIDMSTHLDLGRLADLVRCGSWRTRGLDDQHSRGVSKPMDRRKSATLISGTGFEHGKPLHASRARGAVSYTAPSIRRRHGTKTCLPV